MDIIATPKKYYSTKSFTFTDISDHKQRSMYIMCKLKDNFPNYDIKHEYGYNYRDSDSKCPSIYMSHKKSGNISINLKLINRINKVFNDDNIKFKFHSISFNLKSI